MLNRLCMRVLTLLYGTGNHDHEEIATGLHDVAPWCRASVLVALRERDR
jgi:hypothetical protein